jgi:hypothetical protein
MVLEPGHVGGLTKPSELAGGAARQAVRGVTRDTAMSSLTAELGRVTLDL